MEESNYVAHLMTINPPSCKLRSLSNIWPQIPSRMLSNPENMNRNSCQSSLMETTNV